MIIAGAVSYLDPTVWLAYKVPHLLLTALPPLADSDHTKNLIRATFPHLDPFSEVKIVGGKGSISRKEKRPPHSIFRAVAIVFRRGVVCVTFLLLDNNFMITKASEFLQLFVAGPVMILLNVTFLYTILGWRISSRLIMSYRALVRLAVMLAMVPAAIAFSSMLQSSAKEVSKKGDDRVENVTETMSAVRMVKMFRWEKQILDRIDEKRDIEVGWIWWSKIYEEINLYVAPHRRRQRYSA
ncbi:hypothetical protein DXG01_010261 [Tephrocybe rancida]|nr:hypothetical protein DXG01_010261 [Tephrocybe rancida]